MALVLFVVALAAACGGESSPGTGSFPVEVEGTRIPAAPQRIVSAGASHTEILYAIGAGRQIVATDQFSDYPSAAAATPKLDAFNLGVEAVASFDPDLVVLSFDPGDLQAGLTALGIPTLLLAPPATLEDVYGQIRALGEASGHPGEASALVVEMADEVARLTAALPEQPSAPTYYYELDPTLYSLTSRTFVGGLLAMLGLGNIADAADDGTGYPQLSAEYVLAADPDFILLADTHCCGQSASTVGERPGWGSLQAVAAGRVVELDDDVAQRWGPRVVDLLAVVAEAVYGRAGPG
ncbi:MAG TPA: ABC transporter substrate-binding protein [Acidimicrobiia bacterium]|nr:ABC transporter substrate-binding protein [Acidimicrobiia bacterium]